MELGDQRHQGQGDREVVCLLQEPGEGMGTGTVTPQTHTLAGVALVLRLRGKLASPYFSTPPEDNGESPGEGQGELS